MSQLRALVAFIIVSVFLSGTSARNNIIQETDGIRGDPSVLVTSETQYLYDISTDPNEAVNVLEVPSYASKLTYLYERQAYWADLTIEGNGVNSSELMAKWDVCGRVCPLDTTTKIKETTQTYFNKDAPNIVFVLVDDWGYNDFGARSTYLSWTTPNIDNLASEGILLENYYTNELCSPTRASLLTGRYSLRLGVYTAGDELPLTETTLADELKSAGYINYIVGKWHLGMSSVAQMPISRGFDYFYGFTSGYETYWSKEYGGFVDLFENNDFVTDETALDSDYHSAYLMQEKAEAVISYHSENYPDNPMFLYYPMQLIHYPWTAPEVYLARCMAKTDVNFTNAYESDDANYNTDNLYYNYCAMNVMMDEAIANLTCALKSAGLDTNTYLIIAGDNGGEESMNGNNFPFKGHKNTAMRGAFANTAIIHSALISESLRGTSYTGNIHVTDWLPTIMGLATNQEWTGSMTGADIDGYNQWDAITGSAENERKEIVFISRVDGSYVAQYDNLKLIYHLNWTDGTENDIYFPTDLAPENSHLTCSDPSFLDSKPHGVYSILKPLGLSSTPSVQFILTSVVFSLLAVVILASYVVKGFKSSTSQYQPVGTVDEEARAMI